MGWDRIKAYLQEISRSPLLTFAEEQALARRVRDGDRGARNQMIRARRQLVVAIGKGHIRGGRDRSLDFSDIIEEGNLGLLRAVDKFDCERGEKFSAYASWWVNRSIEQAIASQVSIARLPPYIAEPARAYARTVRRLTQLLGRESSHEEVAREMGIDTHRVRALYQVTQEARPPNKLRIYVRSGNTEFGDMP